MHNNQQAVDKVVVDIFSRQKGAGDRVRPSGRPYKRPPKNIQESTSAKGRMVKEDTRLVLAYSKERFERHQEYWEGYNPGMDADF
jgi:hypothetical protein